MFSTVHKNWNVSANRTCPVTIYLQSNYSLSVRVLESSLQKLPPHQCVDFGALLTCMSALLVRPLRAYTPQGYKTPTAEKARPVRAATTTPTSAQLSSIPLSSSAPKAFYGKNRQTGWQPDDSSPSPSSANTTSSSDSSNSKKYVQTIRFDLVTLSSVMTWGLFSCFWSRLVFSFWSHYSQQLICSVYGNSTNSASITCSLNHDSVS